MNEEKFLEIKNYWIITKKRISEIENNNLWSIESDNYGGFLKYSEKKVEKWRQENKNLYKKNKVLYDWLIEHKIITYDGYFTNSHSDKEIEEDLFFKETKIVEYKLQKNQIILNKSLKINNYVIAFLTFLLLCVTAFQAHENAELTKLTSQELINQYDPEVYIKIDTPKKPWIYSPNKSYLSPYIQLSLKDRYNIVDSLGHKETQNAWMVPMTFTIYNLKSAPLIFEDIYLHNNCIKEDRVNPLMNYILDDNVKDRVITQDNPLNITPLNGVGVEVFPLLEIEDGKGFSNEICEIIFEFKFNNYSKNITEYIRLGP